MRRSNFGEQWMQGLPLATSAALLLALLLLLPASGLASTDFAPNAGFEQQCDGNTLCDWSASPGSITFSTVAHTGSYSLAMTTALLEGTTSFVAGIQSRCVGVSPGSFTLSYWYNSQGVSRVLGAGINSGIGVFSDASCSNQVAGSTGGLITPVSDGAWHQVMDTVAVSPNPIDQAAIVYVQIGLADQREVGAVTTLIDDVYFGSGMPYSFGGFLAPLSTPPAWNSVPAGQTVTVQYTLGGDQGLDTFATWYPISQPVVCPTGVTGTTITQVSSAESSSISYDPITSRYTYVWKTDSTWQGACRQLNVRLNDGSDHLILFQFTK